MLTFILYAKLQKTLRKNKAKIYLITKFFPLFITLRFIRYSKVTNLVLFCLFFLRFISRMVILYFKILNSLINLNYINEYNFYDRGTDLF